MFSFRLGRASRVRFGVDNVTVDRFRFAAVTHRNYMTRLQERNLVSDLSGHCRQTRRVIPRLIPDLRYCLQPVGA